MDERTTAPDGVLLTRIDSLTDAEPDVGSLPGSVLAQSEDAELQAVVAEVCEGLEVPIALVSVLLHRIQYFRAHHGLPADLRCARGTDRDASFCQFVVRDARPFTVTDAATDSRVPQLLVETHGIRAYLGVPVRVHDRVVGSLCAIDTNPRDFSEDELARLQELAARVTHRFETLEAQRRVRERVAAASLPIFAELRNMLMPMQLELDDLQTASVEMGPVFRLLEMEFVDSSGAWRSLANARKHVQALPALVTRLVDAYGRILRNIVSLESATIVRGQSESLAVALREADTMARHTTRLVGGLRLPERLPQSGVAAPMSDVVMVLSAIFTSIAEEMLSRGVSSGFELTLQPEISHQHRLCISVPSVEMIADAGVLIRLQDVVQDALWASVTQGDGHWVVSLTK